MAANDLELSLGLNATVKVIAHVRKIPLVETYAAYFEILFQECFSVDEITFEGHSRSLTMTLLVTSQSRIYFQWRFLVTMPLSCIGFHTQSHIGQIMVHFLRPASI